LARQVPAVREEDLPAALARRPDPLPGEVVVRRRALRGAGGGLGGAALAAGRTTESVLARGGRRDARRVPGRRGGSRCRHAAGVGGGRTLGGGRVDAARSAPCAGAGSGRAGDGV